MPLIYCPRCDHDLPESEFGVCRARPSGKNFYCKKCIREKITEHRRQKREYLATIKHVPRKGNQRVKLIWNMHLKPTEKIALAITRGAKDQAEIRRQTRLGRDEISDGLARLYDQDKLCRQSLRQRVYKLAS